MRRVTVPANPALHAGNRLRRRHSRGGVSQSRSRAGWRLAAIPSRVRWVFHRPLSGPTWLLDLPSASCMRRPWRGLRTSRFRTPATVPRMLRRAETLRLVTNILSTAPIRDATENRAFRPRSSRRISFSKRVLQLGRVSLKRQLAARKQDWQRGARRREAATRQASRRSGDGRRSSGQGARHR